MEEAIWNILTFETSSGEKIVDEFILEQQPTAIRKQVKHASFQSNQIRTL